MRAYRHRKWLMMAALSMGTVLQIATCREQAAFLGLRSAFSAFTLPVNQAIRDFLLAFS